jgi:MFS family permease
MGDLVPEARRGAYFGFRNRVLQTALFLGLVAGGLILQSFEAADDRYSGFATIFLVALVFRAASSFCLSRQIEPMREADREPTPRGGLGALLRDVRATHAGIVIVYLAATNLGIFIATPFFAAYMLEDLRFGYGTLTLVLGAGALGKFVFAPVWGRYSDRFGARKVLVLTGILTPVIPFLWLLGSSLPYLLSIQAFSGFAMGGFELCAFTLLLDATPARRRERLLAYYGLVNGFFTFAGALAGAFLAWNSADLVLLREWDNASRYLLPFLVSGFVRVLVALAFVPRLRDVRVVEPIRYRDLLLRVVTIRPTQGALQRPEIIVGTRDEALDAGRERDAE